MKQLICTFLVTICVHPHLAIAAEAQSATTLVGGLEALVTLRRDLVEEFRSIEEKYRDAESSVRLQVFRAWQARNEERLGAMRFQSDKLAERELIAPLALIQEVVIPENSSPEKEEYLVERARLQNEHTQILNELRGAPRELWRQSITAWASQNRSRLEAQRLRAERLVPGGALEAAPIPATPNIPASASPELRAIITMRHSLIRDQQAEEDRIRSFPPNDQALARREWQRRNEERIAAVAQAAAQLSR